MSIILFTTSKKIYTDKFNIFPTVPVSVGFEQDSSTVMESSGVAEICVAVRDPPQLRRQIRLTVETDEGTASMYIHLS